VPKVVDKVCMKTIQAQAKKNKMHGLNLEEYMITTKKVLSPVSLTKIRDNDLYTPSQKLPFYLNWPKAN
jgi:hypothetical protein